jgi:hypothetical protein
MGVVAVGKAMMQWAIALLLVLSIALGAGGCGDRNTPTQLLGDETPAAAPNPLTGQLMEVSPPEGIQALKPFLDVYQPRVSIQFPAEGATLQDSTVAVRLQVRDFPTSKDPDLGLGPHLHIFMDDAPYQAVYDPSEPILFENLAPGTHTLRVFASRPWHESFKNEGAFDQVTFHLFAPSPQNNPKQRVPLLTYSRPQGTYGAEPIMLDFYLTNTPLHLVAQEDEAVADWRLRCTINGEVFVFDQWQPIYLMGFQPGKNWVKLELIDENDELIDNSFNSALRVIDYQPGGQDGLSRLVRGEVPVAQARRLVDPSYVPPVPAIAPADITAQEGETPGESPGAIAEPQAAPEPLPETTNERSPGENATPPLGELEEPAKTPEPPSLKTDQPFPDTELPSGDVETLVPAPDVLDGDEVKKLEQTLLGSPQAPEDSEALKDPEAVDAPLSGKAPASEDSVSVPPEEGDEEVDQADQREAAIAPSAPPRPRGQVRPTQGINLI